MLCFIFKKPHGLRAIFRIVIKYCYSLRKAIIRVAKYCDYSYFSYVMVFCYNELWQSPPTNSLFFIWKILWALASLNWHGLRMDIVRVSANLLSLRCRTSIMCQTPTPCPVWDNSFCLSNKLLMTTMVPLPSSSSGTDNWCTPCKTEVSDMGLSQVML